LVDAVEPQAFGTGRSTDEKLMQDGQIAVPGRRSQRTPEVNTMQVDQPQLGLGRHWGSRLPREDICGVEIGMLDARGVESGGQLSERTGELLPQFALRAGCIAVRLVLLVPEPLSDEFVERNGVRDFAADEKTVANNPSPTGPAQGHGLERRQTEP